MDLTVLGHVFLEIHVPSEAQRLRPSEEILVPQIEFHLGGAANTATVAHAIGLKTQVIAPTGNLSSPFVKEHLNRRGVALQTWQIPENPATTLVFQLENDRSFLTEAHFETLKSTPIPDNSKWVHVAGLKEAFHLLPVLQALANKSIVSVNMSWAPDELRALSDMTGPRWDFLFMNEKEAEFAVGSSSLSEIFEILQRRAKNIVITRGKEGAAALIDGRILHAPVPRKVDVLDRTGAGDAFIAGFITGRLRDLSPEHSLLLGQEAAGLILQTRSGVPSDFGPFRSLGAAFGIL